MVPSRWSHTAAPGSVGGVNVSLHPARGSGTIRITSKSVCVCYVIPCKTGSLVKTNELSWCINTSDHIKPSTVSGLALRTNSLIVKQIVNQNVSSNCFSIYWNIKPFSHIFWHLHKSGALPKAVLYLKSVKYTLVEFPHFAELWRKTNINNTPASNNYRSQVVLKWKELIFFLVPILLKKTWKRKC